MNHAQTIEKLKAKRDQLQGRVNRHQTSINADDKNRAKGRKVNEGNYLNTTRLLAAAKEELEPIVSAVALLEAAGNDPELLDFIRRRSKVVKADAERTVLQIELPVAKSFREAITAAMKKDPS